MYVEVILTDPDVAKFLPSQVLCMSEQAEGKKGEDENLQANRPTAADQLSTDKKIRKILAENTASTQDRQQIEITTVDNL